MIRTVFSALLLCGLGACMPAVSHECVAGCDSAHDQCILDAHTGAALQACDQRVQMCLASCRSR